MRVMVFVKASKDSEAGVMPSAELLTSMGKFNEELVKAGVLLDANGLHASKKGKRVKFSGQVTPNTKYAIQIDASGLEATTDTTGVSIREGYVAYTANNGDANPVGPP